jgi:hypothetical protein
MRRTPLPALVGTLVLVLALALSACGGAEKKVDVAVGDGGADDSTPTAAPSTGSKAGTPAATPTAAATFFDNEGHEVLRGDVEAGNAAEQAVADTWFAYWTARLNSYGEVAVDPSLGSVAAVEALSDVVGYVNLLRSKKLHTVGDSKFGVTNIEVQGTGATLDSCMVNKSVDQREDGSNAEVLTPFYVLKGTLSQVGGKWRVVKVESVGKDRCQA